MRRTKRKETLQRKRERATNTEQPCGDQEVNWPWQSARYAASPRRHQRSPERFVTLRRAPQCSPHTHEPTAAATLSHTHTHTRGKPGNVAGQRSGLDWMTRGEESHCFTQKPRGRTKRGPRALHPEKESPLASCRSPLTPEANMSSCRKRCKREMFKFAHYLYRLITGTLHAGKVSKGLCAVTSLLLCVVWTQIFHCFLSPAEEGCSRTVVVILDMTLVAVFLEAASKCAHLWSLASRCKAEPSFHRRIKLPLSELSGILFLAIPCGV